MTRRNLELIEPLRAGARGCTLLETMDATVTPMGGRLLRQWLLSPLRDPAAIAYRLDAVEVAVRDGRGRGRCERRSMACGTSSGWRVAPRPGGPLPVSSARCATPFFACPTWPKGSARSPRRRWRRGPSAALADAVDELDLLADLASELGRGLEDRPPAALGDGGVIRAGFDRELDDLRSLRDGGRQYIASLQQRERERTGIPSLKVGFNKVFGYYLEITRAHPARVPADSERRRRSPPPSAT